MAKKIGKKKILAIDDEENILTMVSSRLQASGYGVITATNGKEGLEKVKAEQPDLIILDILMPVMDGFEFLKAIKSDPEASRIPIIILTARGAMKDTFDAMGTDDFVAKPFQAEALLSKIEYVFKDKALMLGNESYVVDKVSAALQKHGFELATSENEDDFVIKGKGTKYKFLVIYLPVWTRDPKELKEFIVPMLRYKAPTILLYSDIHVKGTEDGNKNAIDEVITKWERAGIKAFYDARISQQPLADVIKKWVSMIT